MSDLNTVRGVGPLLARHLREMGIRTASDLAASEPGALTALPRVQLIRARLLIAAAEEALGQVRTDLAAAEPPAPALPVAEPEPAIVSETPAQEAPVGDGKKKKKKKKKDAAKTKKRAKTRKAAKSSKDKASSKDKKNRKKKPDGKKKGGKKNKKK